MKKLLLIFLMTSIAFAGGTTDSLRITKGTKTKRLYVDSTALVDSLNSTKGITSSARVIATDFEASDSVKAVMGTFSGTVKVDSLNSTKNITAPGVKLTGLTSNRVPYQNYSGYLANSSIYTDGTNTSIGKTSLETWGSGFRALQVGGAGALYGTSTEANSPLYLTTNCYYDGINFKPMYGSGSARSTIYLQEYNGEHRWYSNLGLTADAAFTPTLRMTLDADGNLSPTGRITGTDFEASDSMKAVTGTFTGRVKAQSMGELYGTDSVCAIKGHFATTVTSGTASAHDVTATTGTSSPVYDIGTATPNFYVRKIGNGDMEIGNGDRALNPKSKIFIDSTIADSTVMISHDTTKVKTLFANNREVLTDTELVDYSASLSVQGWASFVDKTCFYKKIGKFVYVYMSIAGTSNSQYVKVYLPFEGKSGLLQYFSGAGIDNGSSILGPCHIQVGSGTDTYIAKQWGGNNNTWTASGSKAIVATFTYLCN